MRKRGRVDGNHAEIREAFRSVGASVCDLSAVGEGCPDLLVGFRTHLYLVEVKSSTGTLTEAQEAFLAHFPVHVVRTVEEALRLLQESW